MDGQRIKEGWAGGWTDEEERGGEGAAWKTDEGRQGDDGIHTPEGRRNCAQEDQLEGVQGTRGSGTGMPPAAPAIAKAHFQPQPHLPLGTFLAPSFRAFFLASSKSSFWPMLA